MICRWITFSCNGKYFVKCILKIQIHIVIFTMGLGDWQFALMWIWEDNCPEVEYVLTVNTYTIYSNKDFENAAICGKLL